MGSKKKKKDATYQVAVSGAKGAIRILLYVLLNLCPDFCWKNGIQFRVSESSIRNRRLIHRQMGRM